LLCLAKNPEKQARLREEVMKVLPNKNSEFTEASMKNVPYLRACIKESQRLHPLIVGNARVLARDAVLSGYRVPAGTYVNIVPLNALTRDEYFPQASEFLPERWLRSPKDSESKCPANELKSTNPFVFLPFGFGPRMCVGKRIVEMELELGIPSQGKSWGDFRSIVNPVLMQPKNVRLYFKKMSQVNQEFVEL